MSITKHLCIALLAMLSFNTFAQDSAGEQDPKAKKILDALSAKTKTFTSIAAEFTSTLDNKSADLHVENKGQLKMQGDKYNLTLGNHNIITDGTTTWTLAKEDNEVYVDNNEDMEDEDAIKPSELFTIWESGFKYKYEQELNVKGKNCDLINLYPKNPAEKNFHTIKLFVDKIKQEIAMVVMMGKGGETITYELTKFTPNATVTASEFTFDKAKHPGVDVIDNR